MRYSRRPRLSADETLGLLPMIELFLICILVFSYMSVEQRYAKHRPSQSSTVSAQDHPLTILLDVDGLFKHEGQSLNTDELLELLQAKEPSQVLLRIHRVAPYEYVLDARDVCTRAGITAVGETEYIP